MAGSIGIRREDKNRWEARAPLAPKHVRNLVDAGVKVRVQPSEIRAFDDAQYADAGAEIAEDLGECDVVMGVKEMPARVFEPDKVYVFFSHTIKGQKDNMPMLASLMEKGASLIDYEKITDRQGRRLVFFGRHAGLAGMIDTFWALGQRLSAQGMDTPFARLQQAYRYPGLDAAKQAVAELGESIEKDGLPDALCPLVIGLAGYGNVSKGAQEIIDLLPVTEVSPGELGRLEKMSRKVVKVVFHERHMVRPVVAENGFDLQDYYDHPEKYESRFEEFLPHLSVLVNCIFWTERYPRLVTRQWVENAWRRQTPKLAVIGDISCDLEGAVQVTVKATDPGDPVFVYDIDEAGPVMGVRGNGPVVLAVDNLPCELPKDSTMHFGESLEPFLPALAGVDPGVALSESGLPEELARAVVVWRGRLTPSFEYIEEFLRELGGG